MSKEYQKIKGLGSGRGLQLGLRSRIYAHEDHLLVVQSTGYTEDYKRLFYRDIRYVVMRKTYGQEIQAVISGILVLATLCLALTPMPWWISLLICAPFLTWFVLNWIWGSTGKCYANTAIQTIQLPAPRRLNRLPVLIEFLGTKTPPA